MIMSDTAVTHSCTLLCHVQFKMISYIVVPSLEEQFQSLPLQQNSNFCFVAKRNQLRLTIINKTYSPYTQRTLTSSKHVYLYI